MGTGARRSGRRPCASAGTATNDPASGRCPTDPGHSGSASPIRCLYASGSFGTGRDASRSAGLAGARTAPDAAPGYGCLAGCYATVPRRPQADRHGRTRRT